MSQRQSLITSISQEQNLKLSAKFQKSYLKFKVARLNLPFAFWVLFVHGSRSDFRRGLRNAKLSFDKLRVAKRF